MASKTAPQGLRQKKAGAENCQKPRAEEHPKAAVGGHVEDA